LIAEFGYWVLDVLSINCMKHCHALFTPSLTLHPRFMAATNLTGSLYVAQMMPPVLECVFVKENVLIFQTAV